MKQSCFAIASSVPLTCCNHVSVANRLHGQCQDCQMSPFGALHDFIYSQRGVAEAVAELQVMGQLQCG